MRLYLFAFVLSAFLLVSSLSKACVYFNVTYYHKMCDAQTCGFVKPAEGLALVVFDEKRKSRLAEVVEAAPNLQVKYQMDSEISADKRNLFIKISTEFIRNGRMLIHSEKSDLILNTKDFTPIKLAGEAFIGGGYKWLPFFEVHPSTKECL